MSGFMLLGQVELTSRIKKVECDYVVSSMKCISTFYTVVHTNMHTTLFLSYMKRDC